jgi:hypothetical protein
MAAAIRGYRMVLIMPEDLSIERAQTMKAFGAELILTPALGGMEYARDLAEQMQRDGKGRVLDQFANADNPRVHYETTGPEIWADTGGRVTHFVSAMGTTGTITGVSRYLKEQNPAVRIVGAQPAEGSRIPGIRKWPEAYLPKIYDPAMSTSWCWSARPTPRTWRAAWRARRACSPASRRRRLLGGAAAGAAGWRTPPSSSSSATAATATCPPGCSRHERQRTGGALLPALCHAARAGHHAGRGRRRQERLRCPACGWTHWNNPTPVLAAVIECADQGGQRAAGAQCRLAGAHVRADHRLHGGRRDAEDGITREVAEETRCRCCAGR